MPDTSSPYERSSGIQPYFIQLTWPSQSNPRCLSSVYIVERPAHLRTSVFGTLSLHLMLRMWRRQHMWKLFSLCSCFAYVSHASQPHRRMLIMQALYTAILVMVDSLGFSQTHVASPPNVVAVFPMHWLTSASKVFGDCGPKIRGLVYNS